MKTPPAQARVLTPAEIAEMNGIRWWHRITLGTDESGATVTTPGEVNHGPQGGDWPTTRFGLPRDLSGKSVLDVGAWDGFFSFEAEKRGACCVVAADVPQEAGGNWGGTAGFEFARRILGSSVDFVGANIYDLDRDLSAPFDVVLCYGVLYHLKEPVRAIEQLFAATKPGGICFIETAADPNPYLKTLPTWSLRQGHDGDPTNFWYPSVGGLRAACEMAGFVDFRIVSDMGVRFTASCRKPMSANEGAQSR